ncbi:MAG: hypothetical protein J6O99_08185 [Methanobrevibacter sp.]|nr:hypothetical protein [Methanobrevibacter sp.]
MWIVLAFIFSNLFSILFFFVYGYLKGFAKGAESEKQIQENQKGKAEDFGKELDEISSKVIEEQEARDLLSAINCYLLCDFGVQDVEMQAQAAAEKERIIKIQEKLKKIVGE